MCVHTLHIVAIEHPAEHLALCKPAGLQEPAPTPYEVAILTSLRSPPSLRYKAGLAICPLFPLPTSLGTRYSGGRARIPCHQCLVNTQQSVLVFSFTSTSKSIQAGFCSFGPCFPVLSCHYVRSLLMKMDRASQRCVCRFCKAGLFNKPLALAHACLCQQESYKVASLLLLMHRLDSSKMKS